MSSFSLFNCTKWGIRGTVTVNEGESSIEFPTKALADKDSISLVDFINSETDLKDGSHFLLHPLKFNGTLQSMASTSYTTPEIEKNFYYGRRVKTFNDGGCCSLDYLLDVKDKENFFRQREQNLKNFSNWPRQNKNVKFLSEEEIEQFTAKSDIEDNILIVLHGLGGGSHEPLIRDFISQFKDTKNFSQILVLNNRGCSRSKITTPELFCGKSTQDLRELIQEINELTPNRKIYLAGFSWGTVSLINYLSEESLANRYLQNNVKLAITVGTVWDLVSSSYHLLNSVSGKYLFQPALVSFLTRMVKNNADELKLSETHPNIHFDQETLKSMKTLVQFDNTYTSKLFGFNNAMEYYRKASPINYVCNIKTPLIAINSTDDPCIDTNLPVLESSTNPYVVQVSTDIGGHLVYLDMDNKCWVNQRVAEVFERFVDLIDTNSEINDLGYESKVSDFAKKEKN